VVATLTPSDGPQQTHEFTNNGSFTFHFSDDAGNSSSAVASVSNIDLSIPSAEISYNPSTLTNGNVTATLTPSEGLLQTHTFTTNGSHSFTFANDLGVSNTATATVTWIDKTPPVLAVNPPHLDLELGNFFMPWAWVEATDDRDGDLTDQIIITGWANPMRRGNYALHFAVSDDAGNAASATRTIAVNLHAPFMPRTPGRHIAVQGEDGLQVIWDERFGSIDSIWIVSALPAIGRVLRANASELQQGDDLSFTDFPFQIVDVDPDTYRSQELVFSQPSRAEDLVIELLSGVPYIDIAFQPGWNLFAAPVTPLYSLDALFPATLRIGGFLTFSNGNYQSVTSLAAGQACWVFITHSFQLRLLGTPATGLTPASPGWNLLGSVGSSPTTPPGASQLWWFDSENHQFRSTDELQPGRGYWMFSE
jgi:hypothetical protein